MAIAGCRFESLIRVDTQNLILSLTSLGVEALSTRMSTWHALGSTDQRNVREMESLGLSLGVETPN